MASSVRKALFRSSGEKILHQCNANKSVDADECYDHLLTNDEISSAADNLCAALAEEGFLPEDDLPTIAGSDIFSNPGVLDAADDAHNNVMEPGDEHKINIVPDSSETTELRSSYELEDADMDQNDVEYVVESEQELEATDHSPPSEEYFGIQIRTLASVSRIIALGSPNSFRYFHSGRFYSCQLSLVNTLLNGSTRSFHIKMWKFELIKLMDDPAMQLFVDDQIVIIKDGYPKAEKHFLVLPKEDISNLASVKKDDIKLLKHMDLKGRDIAEKYGEGRTFRLGYHAQPSMERLHLHVISDDMNSASLKHKKHWNSFTTPFFMDSN
ncbi:hypothetical protein GE061_016941, partial [Apolygus lucorum]